MKRNLIKTLILVSAVFVVAIGYKSYKIIIEPFPLVSMEYIEDISVFNEQPTVGALNYDLQGIIPEMVLSVRRRIGAELPAVLSSDYDKMVSVTTSTTMYQYPEIINPICSEHAKYFVYLARQRGINARVIWLRHHTASEVFHSRYGWVMVDTYGNQMFRDKQNGAYASVTDLVNNYDDYMLIRPVPEFPGYRAENLTTNGSYEIYKNQDLIVEIDYEDTYTMPLMNRSLSFFFKSYFIRMDMYGRQLVRKSSEEVGNLNLWKIIVSTF